MTHLLWIAVAAMTALPILPATADTPIPKRLFISGHSLVDQPLPAYVAAIAQSLGTPLQWNRQYMVGSAIVTRVRGSQAGATGWDGYRQGYNREGNALNLLAEWHAPKTVHGGLYDTLLITEQHGLLGSLLWHDTVRYLRHYHDRFVYANPRAQTWFYESWLGLDDKSDPRRWIAYERAASPIWQCIATRINLSLAAEGRADRIERLPAGIALAGLVERATQGAGVAGVTAASVRETVDRIVQDTVHLTPLGSYYIALVSYATMAGREPAGAWAPSGIDALTAQSLQSVAWELVQQERHNRRTPSLDDCQDELQRRFIAHYWGYVRDATWQRELGSAHAYLRWAKYRAQWHWRLRRGSADNPLHYDAATDRAHWLPAP